jgi:ABC-type sugar transport system ATPase subunit
LHDHPSDRFVAIFLGWPPMNFLDGELSEIEDRLRFGNRDVSLVLSSRPEWRSLMGKPLTLGIRPEGVGLAEGPGESRLEMQVQLVERLGPVQLATLDRRDTYCTGWKVTARFAVRPAPDEGATIFAAFDLTRAHLFDPATGRALCHGRVEGMNDEG